MECHHAELGCMQVDSGSSMGGGDEVIQAKVACLLSVTNTIQGRRVYSGL